jgi:DNA-binding NarL/FixJ family response regulator
METKHLVALVADDHELFRAGLAAVLARHLGCAEVIEAGSFPEAAEHLRRRPEITLATFDTAMPGMSGAASLRTLCEVFPALRIAVITGSNRREDILLALATGVHGYAPKTLRVCQIVDALRVVLDGQIFVPPGVAELRVVPSEGSTEATTLRQAAKVDLTPRQRQVVRLIAEGKSNKEIARALDLAEGTVKVHVNSLYRTLSARNRASAVAAVVQRTSFRAS